MESFILGFIGFGEAAYLLSKGLISEGMKTVYAYDAYPSEKVKRSAIELGIELEDSLGSLIERSDIIFCAASAKVAESISQEAKAYLQPGKIYVDINAASSMVKEAVAKNVEESGALFVDAAVMESVPLRGHKVPILISGEGALTFQEQMKPFGMNLTYMGEKPGAASGIKMLRSVFIKGFTMLLLETLEVSEQMGVTDIILKSIEETISVKPLEQTVNMLLVRTASHAERRVAEMGEVIQTLSTFGTDSSMSKAVKEKLQQLVHLGLKEQFNGTPPASFHAVINTLHQLRKTGGKL